MRVLLVDRTSAAEPLGAVSVREWAEDKRVFISSVMSELHDERMAAARAIRSLGAKPVLFEDFGGRDSDPEQAYLSEVESSNIYLGIVGRRYGKMSANRFSATHAEYLHAEKNGLRIASWALRADDREGHTHSLLEEMRTFHVVPLFSSPEDLEVQVLGRLNEISAQEIAPWVKLGDIVFRATEVTRKSGEMVVKARVRGSEVTHALESLAGESFSRNDQMLFTWAGRSRYVTVSQVDSTVTAARSTALTLHLQESEKSQDSNWDVSIGSLSSADVFEAALRSAVLGLPNPTADRVFGFMEDVLDPLQPIRDRPLSEEIVRPIAELLITEALVGVGRAVRITNFRLGVPVRGERRLLLSWQPKSRQTGKDITRSIDGVIRL